MTKASKVITALILGTLALSTPRILAQDANTTTQQAGSVVEDIVLLNKRTGRNMIFRISVDATTGTSYTIDGQNVSQWVYENIKGNLRVLGIHPATMSAMDAATQMRQLWLIDSFKLSEEDIAIQTLRTDLIMGFEYYIINGKHYYFVDSKPATKAEYDAKVHKVTAMFHDSNKTSPLAQNTPSR